MFTFVIILVVLLLKTPTLKFHLNFYLLLIMYILSSNDLNFTKLSDNKYSSIFITNLILKTTNQYIFLQFPLEFYIFIFYNEILVLFRFLLYLLYYLGCQIPFFSFSFLIYLSGFVLMSLSRFIYIVISNIYIYRI